MKIQIKISKKARRRLRKLRSTARKRMKQLTADFVQAETERLRKDWGRFEGGRKSGKTFSIVGVDPAAGGDATVRAEISGDEITRVDWRPTLRPAWPPSTIDAIMRSPRLKEAFERQVRELIDLHTGAEPDALIRDCEGRIKH